MKVYSYYYVYGLSGSMSWNMANTSKMFSSEEKARIALQENIKNKRKHYGNVMIEKSVVTSHNIE